MANEPCCLHGGGRLRNPDKLATGRRRVRSGNETPIRRDRGPVRRFGGIGIDLFTIKSCAKAVHQREDLRAACIARICRTLEMDCRRGIVPVLVLQQALFSHELRRTIACMCNGQPPSSKNQSVKSAHIQVTPAKLLNFTTRGGPKAASIQQQPDRRGRHHERPLLATDSAFPTSDQNRRSNTACPRSELGWPVVADRDAGTLSRVSLSRDSACAFRAPPSSRNIRAMRGVELVVHAMAQEWIAAARQASSCGRVLLCKVHQNEESEGRSRHKNAD